MFNMSWKGNYSGLANEFNYVIEIESYTYIDITLVGIYAYYTFMHICICIMLCIWPGASHAMTDALVIVLIDAPCSIHCSTQLRTSRSVLGYSIAWA